MLGRLIAVIRHALGDRFSPVPYTAKGVVYNRLHLTLEIHNS
jgi:hypothetical protein